MFKYQPIYKDFFNKYGYTWEDIDFWIYPKLLKEEGYTNEQIKKEMMFLKEKCVF